MGYQVKVLPQDKSITIEENQNLLAALKQAGFYIKSSCGGCASCTDCIVVIKAGEDNLQEQSFEETRLLGNIFHLTKERLSCQTKVVGDITIDISNHDQATLEAEREKKQKVKTQLKKKNAEPEVLEPREPKPAKQGGFRKPKAFKYSDDE